MDDRDSNKRLKSSSGAPINAGRGAPSSAAANLPAYQPPAAIGARGGAPAGYVASFPSLFAVRQARLTPSVCHVEKACGCGLEASRIFGRGERNANFVHSPASFVAPGEK